jgi:hypothetical protein
MSSIGRDVSPARRRIIVAEKAGHIEAPSAQCVGQGVALGRRGCVSVYAFSRYARILQLVVRRVESMAGLISD